MKNKHDGWRMEAGTKIMDVEKFNRAIADELKAELTEDLKGLIAVDHEDPIRMYLANVEEEVVALRWVVGVLILALIAIFLAGCGDFPNKNNPWPPVTPEPTLEATPEPTPSNPPCIEVMGKDGNRPPQGGFLLKNSDHDGTAVALLPSEYVEPFSLVQIRMPGGWETMRFTGFSNETRQTWRATGKVRRYIQENGNIRIEAFLGEESCVWRIEDADRRRND